MDILRIISYRIPAPTALDFLKYYLKEVLMIGDVGKSHKPKESTSASEHST